MPTLLSPEIAGCFARACKTIAENNSFANKNDLFMSIINDKAGDVSAVADEVVHHYARMRFPICENRLSQIENRPKKGRNVGECMDNCVSEFYETGNQIRVGFVSCATSSTAALAVLHFFNVDRHGVFYDTEDHEKAYSRPMTLLKFSHNEVARMLAGFQKEFLKEANDWMSVWDEMNKKTYILSRTFGERGAFKFVKTLETTIQGTSTVVVGF